MRLVLTEHSTYHVVFITKLKNKTERKQSNTSGREDAGRSVFPGNDLTDYFVFSSEFLIWLQDNLVDLHQRI
jgi:hypothetical protein